MARQTHGDHVQVSVRPVRTGGILGFFASERYVADIADAAETSAPGHPVTGVVVPPPDDLSVALDDLDALFTGDAPSEQILYGAAQRVPAPVPHPVQHHAAPVAPVTPTAAPASPFALALARMSTDVAVTEAVQVATKTTTTEHRFTFPTPTAPSTPSITPTSAPAGLAPVPSEVELAPGTAMELAPDAYPVLGSLPHTPVEDPTRLLPRLKAAGLPDGFIPDGFLPDVSERGLHAALTRLLRMRLPKTEKFPIEPGTVLVLGPGIEALPAARTVARMLRCDPATVRWAAPDDLSGLVPATRRLKSLREARDWITRPRRTHRTDIVAVSSTFTETGCEWTTALLDSIDPDWVLTVVDATRKPEDVRRWLTGLPRTDGLVLHNAATSADPATFMLPSGGAPVVIADGKRVTVGFWTSLLCERLGDA